MDETRFLDYVSRRSPALKDRPLPSSKREAIDLMVEQPNLIKRPVLVVGRRAIFGWRQGPEGWGLDFASGPLD